MLRITFSLSLNLNLNRPRRRLCPRPRLGIRRRLRPPLPTPPPTPPVPPPPRRPRRRPACCSPNPSSALDACWLCSGFSHNSLLVYLASTDHLQMRNVPDKSFIFMNKKERYTDPRFSQGLKAFLDYAEQNPRRALDGRMHCPCNKCANRYLLCREVIEEHVIVNGFIQQYISWTCHGEGLSDERWVYVRSTTQHWKGDRAKEESSRNCTNRKRKQENYYGGNVPAQRYRYAMDLAGGDASLSTTWQVLHTTDSMSEEALQTQREHWEHLAAGEQSFRDDHPKFLPEQLILPLEVEAAIMQREFPNAAAKGRLSIVGSYRSTSSSRGSSTGGDFYYSQQAEELRQLRQRYEEQTEAHKKLQEDYQVLSSRQQKYEQQQSRLMEQLAQLTARVARSSSSQGSSY